MSDKKFLEKKEHLVPPATMREFEEKLSSLRVEFPIPLLQRTVKTSSTQWLKDENGAPFLMFKNFISPMLSIALTRGALVHYAALVRHTGALNELIKIDEKELSKRKGMHEHAIWQAEKDRKLSHYDEKKTLLNNPDPIPKDKIIELYPEKSFEPAESLYESMEFSETSLKALIEGEKLEVEKVEIQLRRHVQDLKLRTRMLQALLKVHSWINPLNDLVSKRMATKNKTVGSIHEKLKNILSLYKNSDFDKDSDFLAALTTATEKSSDPKFAGNKKHDNYASRIKELLDLKWDDFKNDKEISQEIKDMTGHSVLPYLKNYNNLKNDSLSVLLLLLASNDLINLKSPVVSEAKKNSDVIKIKDFWQKMKENDIPLRTFFQCCNPLLQNRSFIDALGEQYGSTRLYKYSMRTEPVQHISSVIDKDKNLEDKLKFWIDLNNRYVDFVKDTDSKVFPDDISQMLTHDWDPELRSILNSLKSTDEVIRLTISFLVRMYRFELESTNGTKQNKKKSISQNKNTKQKKEVNPNGNTANRAKAQK